MRRSLRLAAGILLLGLAVLAVWYFGRPAPIRIAGEEETPFEMTVLDVGQGLGVLIRADGRYMLYDGGGRDTSSFVVSFLRQRGAEHIDLLVASHYDEDHVAGLVGVLSALEVDAAWTPDYAVDTKIYSSFQKAAALAGTETHPAAGETFSLGGAEITVLGPARWDYAQENDRSICLMVRYGDLRVLLTGDAEREAETEMAAGQEDLGAQVYVAGHHGSAASSTKELLDAVRPKAVIVSCGKENPYGHPAEGFLSRVREAGADLYRTDLQGSIVLRSDGKDWWMNLQPTEDWTPGALPAPSDAVASAAPEDTRQQVPAGGEAAYVVNENSRKFHLPDCPSVGKMKPENRRDTDESRESLIEQGYEPCGMCKP